MIIANFRKRACLGGMDPVFGAGRRGDVKRAECQGGSSATSESDEDESAEFALAFDDVRDSSAHVWGKQDGHAPVGEAGWADWCWAECEGW